MTIQKVCILGAGTLGSRVALQAAISGYTVSVYDIHEKALDFGFQTMKKNLVSVGKRQAPEGSPRKNTFTDLLYYRCRKGDSGRRHCQ